MKHSKIPLSQTVVGLCKTLCVRQIVISPGSRNAPLTIGFTHNEFFKCYSIVDERCAGFFALGIAQRLQEPVALVCTSGSALLNYYPAISEAYYSHISLIVLSADRPKHMVDIGDGQTIKQKQVYGEHVVYSANLKLDLKDDYQQTKDDELPIFKNLENKLERFLGLQKDIQTYNEIEIQSAIQMAKGQSRPVHLNIPFEEPLYETTEVSELKFNLKTRPRVDAEIDSFELEDALQLWHKAKRKLVLVGVLQPNSIEAQWLEELARDESVVVFTETTSNLHHKIFFPSIDQIIAPLDMVGFEHLKPDIVLTLGGMVVSKKIKAFLRTYKPSEHWHVGPFEANDTFFLLTKHFKVSLNAFFSNFFEALTHTIKSDYRSHWLNVKRHRLHQHKAYIKDIPFSDFKVFSDVIKSLPKNSQLHIGNSSAIRYAQLFNSPESIEVFCNRGTSGIDGSTSTAIGSASVANQRTTFITGDLSFFYDSNALWNNYTPNDFRVIIINNQGGGIFRILPGHKNTENFDIYFETKHKLTAEHLCKMYGFDYASAKNQAILERELNTFYEDSDRPKVLEIFTPSEINDEILLQYFDFIK
ncbi:2-succinyl-5-enolpyruvyl-6-hydroxy-3-cyclohexene-1-carboxylic-acid synthase [Winogradskyella maritima]|uniref:2-succinyl-5-enolpyruvyl-6-hydroxy-3-cyclohexene-1-carboxylate synthase n=1 Tax=Winogradskyella maritima TaxID=1517766 RepID=A0ABV8ALD1_9FLAO|nr:2-succinyl-5-enolpyruvyl-6-hydroxy-3-cyclohexene-1-carboxylic-acid synthase [Winogradskyella maritima]